MLDFLNDVRLPLWVLVGLEVWKLVAYRLRLWFPRAAVQSSGPEYVGDELIIRDNNGNFYGFRHPGSPDLEELKNYGFTVERKK